MELIVWIIVGGLAGWIASIIMKTNAEMGAFSNIIVGMIGSVLGGAIISFFSGGGFKLSTDFNNFNLTSILVSIVGAIVFLAIVKALRK